MISELDATHSVMALTDTWLDATAVTLTTGGYMPTSNLVWPPCQTLVYSTYPSPARPIKLTLSEIDRLRKSARADKALKAILAKFTDQIEITVDFE